MMDYRGVDGRIAVDIGSLEVPISGEAALALLFRKGFLAIPVDLIALARSCIGHAGYRRGARLGEAPGTFDCSSFVKWLYGKRGIWLPRRSIQQCQVGTKVRCEDIASGDLVFVSGHIDYYLHDPLCGIGHVGIASGEGTVIHAANKKAGVIETPLARFLGKDRFRDVRRYIPIGRNVVTLEVPEGREVETEDDVRWIIRQSL